MTDKKINSYWNTWDPIGINRIIKFPELLEISIAIFSPQKKSYTSKFYFIEYQSDAGNVVKLGLHSHYGEYTCTTLSAAGFIFEIEYATVNNKLICQIIPITVTDPFTLILVEVFKRWEEQEEVELKEDKIISFNKINILVKQDYYSKYNTGEPITFGIYSSEDELINDLNSSNKLNEEKGKGNIVTLGFLARMPLKILVQENVNMKELGNVGKIINAAKEKYKEIIPKIIGGPFNNAAQILTSVMNWCVVWDQIHYQPYTPVTRSWIDNYMVRMGLDKETTGPILGLWDNLFNALLHSIDNQEFARANVYEVLADDVITDDGYPPNYVVSTILKSGDRSQPPIGTLVLWKLYRKFNNKEFLKWAYSRLKRWHNWWRHARDGNGDGLLEWGSNYKVKDPGNDAGTLFAAACESGMDNSPLYDDAKFYPEIGTMNLNDIGLNSLYTADAYYLSLIANELGLKEDNEYFKNEYEQLKEKINNILWNDKKAAYMDRYWDGNFSEHLAPTCFYPLLAKIPSEDKVEKIINKHLLNEKEFWGEFVLPSISKEDKAFKEQLYWRGRIWPPMNYLVYLGLKEYNLDEISYEYAIKNVNLFMKEWQKNSHCHENYNAITGYGCDVPIKEKPYEYGSDRFYSWGALLLLIAIEELIDIEMEEGIRFGCYLLQEKTTISNILLQGANYKIISYNKETVAEKDSKVFFKAIPGVSIRNYIVTKDYVKFRAAGWGNTNFTITEFLPNTKVQIIVNDLLKDVITSSDAGSISFNNNLTKEYTQFLLKRLPS